MIRVLEPGDRTAWADLWTQYLTFYETALPQAVYDTLWTRLFDPAEPVFGALAIQDGVPVGLVHFLYHRTAWSEADSCYLQDLFTAPAGRGQGHGRALIDYVAAQAKAHGASRLYWNTHETNATARALYDKVAQRSGFIQYRKALS